MLGRLTGPYHGSAIASRRWPLAFDSSQWGIYGEQIDAHASFSPSTSGLVPSSYCTYWTYSPYSSSICYYSCQKDKRSKPGDLQRK